MVAIAAVHWPAEWDSYGQLWEGYVITAKGAGNYKLPLLLALILLPLVFHGGGKISLDHLLLKFTGRDSYTSDRIGDGIGAAMVFAVMGLATIFLLPAWGISFFVMAVILGLIPALRQ